MTLEEAKKILEKEGFHLALAPKVINQTGAIKKFEKPEVCEAIKVANANRWTVALSPTEWDQREARLKDEYEKNTKAPGPGEEQLEEKKRIICCNASPKADFYYKHVLNEGNPALKESASQFNDALLDEQGKKIAAYKKLHFYDTKTLKRKDEIIEELRDKNAELLGMVERMKENVKDIDTNLNAANETNKCLNKKVVELSKIKGDLNSWISGLYFCIHHNNDNYKYKLKRLGKEVSKLNSIIHDKNAVLSDVAEELRLSKIREKNLVEVSQKYMKENEKLKKELADKVVDKIDAQALKSAESAHAWKEKVFTYKDMALAYYEKKIAEKDEVIADLGKELAATKTKLEKKTKLVEAVRKSSKEDRDYGIAAEKMIQKMAKAIVGEKPICSEDFEQYRLWANGYRFNPQLPDFSEEEEKKLNAAKMVYINAMCMRAARESINDVFESYAAKYAKSSLDDLKEKAYELFNAKAHNLGLVGSKDGNGIIDQMVGAGIAEEGGDQSATIVQCDNGITISKEEAEIIERCTKNGTELHYSEKDGLTYTNVFGKEMPIRCLRGMFHVFTDEEIENMKE